MHSSKPTCGINGRTAKVALLFVLASACTVLAEVVCVSEKSYFVDTRCPIVAMSGSGALDTNPAGMLIIFR